MNFTGKTALITGSGTIGGLGHAVATVLAAGGAEVVITGLDPQRAGRVVEEITGKGGRARFIEADLGDPDAVRRLAEQAGPVDILINNAGVVPVAPTPQQEVAAYDAAFAVNTRAPSLLTAALAPKMAANGGGSIVNVTSTAAGLGMPGMAVYGASKAALESLTRTWAAEFATGNVRVNAVSPGPMHTAKAVAMMGPDVGGLGKTTPLSRTADPAEVAQVIAFVASDLASNVTGAVIAADGGRTAI